MDKKQMENWVKKNCKFAQAQSKPTPIVTVPDVAQKQAEAWLKMPSFAPGSSGRAHLMWIRSVRAYRKRLAVLFPWMKDDELSQVVTDTIEIARTMQRAEQPEPESTTDKSEPHSLNPHPESNDDGW